MSKKKLFVFEFITGGGYNQEEIPPSLFCEAYGMLRGLISDFKELDFEIATLLDYRIFPFSDYLNIKTIIKVDKQDNYIEKFEQMVKLNESCFIIAPEFSNILYNLTKIVKYNNKELLSIDLEGIILGTSKTTTYQFFKSNKVKTPDTYSLPPRGNYFDSDFVLQKFNEIRSPIIIKPEDGVGADAIYYFENESQILDFFRSPQKQLDITHNYILQNFIEGEDLSISLIGDGKSAPLILTINYQDIRLKNLNAVSNYLGGHTPIEQQDKIKAEIRNLLQKINLNKFIGYFGIDLIRKENGELYFIEINPRLTTSYIGIRNVIDINPAKLILDSKLSSLKNIKIDCIRHSLYTKLEMIYEGDDSYEKIYKNILPEILAQIPEVITPPISFNQENGENFNKFSCFIATRESSLAESKKRLKEIKRIFERRHFKILK